ncbi:MAG: hypothetical protein IKA76_01690, partial [Clostridia bacterium]|nr:hypothetical protein [Clostridia bacterium]
MEAFERQGADSPPDLSGAIEKIMAHPELISAVASALGKTPPSEEKPAVPPPEAETVSVSSPDLSAASALLPLLTNLQKGASKPPDNDRSRLLCALKPYVSPQRRNAIDTLLRFSQIEE